MTKNPSRTQLLITNSILLLSEKTRLAKCLDDLQCQAVIALLFLFDEPFEYALPVVGLWIELRSEAALC
jgi:hypothetical protein